MYNNEKRTDSHAGEKLPSKEEREKLLNEVMDEYDEDEEELVDKQMTIEPDTSKSILKKEEQRIELMNDLISHIDQLPVNNMSNRMRIK